MPVRSTPPPPLPQRGQPFRPPKRPSRVPIIFILIGGLVLLRAMFHAALVVKPDAPTATVRTVTPFRTPRDFRTQRLIDGTGEVGDFRYQIERTITEGQTRLAAIERLQSELQSRQAQYSEQRDAARKLRQGLGQARVVAEAGGRWPVHVERWVLGRSEIGDAIDRTERYLERSRKVVDLLNDIGERQAAAVANARNELDVMAHVRAEVDSASEQSGLRAARLQELRVEFRQSSSRFDRSVNDPAIGVVLPELRAFDLDSARD
jgi:hypothetical protein